MKDVVVSIICNTYNHEKHIERAILGFIMQETDFDFEVLIHDDASTDDTAKIVKKYEEQYPEIIKPIYQTENQYSINSGNIQHLQFSRVKGEYVAFCEGDDYWTDPQKLSKQVKALEQHPELDLCAHGAKICQYNKEIGKIAPKKDNCIILVEEIIQGGGEYIATNSLMIRNSLLEHIPLFVEIHPIDYAYQVYASLRGGALYLNEEMSVYNYMNTGSWTERRRKNLDFAVDQNKKCIHMLEELDKYTNHRYWKLISEQIIQEEYGKLWYQGKIQEIIDNKQLYAFLTPQQKFKLQFRKVFPRIYEQLQSWNRYI